MSQRLYLLTVGMIFLLFTLGNLLRVILMPPGGAPVWASFIAAIITGFLSYEGFHFARKLPPKG